MINNGQNDHHSEKEISHKLTFWGEESGTIHATIRTVSLLVVLVLFFSGGNESYGRLLRVVQDQFMLTGQHADEILIPSLGLRAPVLAAGSWEDRDVRPLLQDGVVLLPTEGWLKRGNLVITAHSSGTARLGDKRFLFAAIHVLKHGDAVYFWHRNYLHIYKVTDSKIVRPGAITALPDGDGETLTLVSCWPVGSNDKRILVTAGLKF